MRLPPNLATLALSGCKGPQCRLASNTNCTLCSPPQVDWLGQRAQIDLAIKHNYKQASGVGPLLLNKALWGAERLLQALGRGGFCLSEGRAFLS